MQWIDIILPEPETNQEFEKNLAEAIKLAGEMSSLQQKQGLDSPLVLDKMAEVGRCLFLALIAHDSRAFTPEANARVFQTPSIGLAEHDDLTGYHIVANDDRSALPWTWLHNGIEFVLEKHPICTNNHSARLPDSLQSRPWMSRCTRAEFLVSDEGDSDLINTLDQLRPADLATPEILFVPGHTDDKIRRMIQREAEAISASLVGERLGHSLASLDLPTESITPAQLKVQGINYQAIHFAGPTSQPAVSSDTLGQYWMNRLIDEVNTPEDLELEEAFGVEGELVGVDPITSMLDSVAEKYDREGITENRVGAKGISQGSTSSNGGGNSSPWLLEDGPVDPEGMSLAGSVPPLVFSNSHLALPELGQRFTRAGASTFIGPVVPLFSRPARIFASYLYHNLADGWSSGPAVWKASGQIRQELGKDHPAWLSYGLRGYGTLALQYL